MLKGAESRKKTAENIGLFNQSNPDEVRYKYLLNLEGKMYCICDRSNGVLMLYIEVDGYSPKTYSFFALFGCLFKSMGCTRSKHSSKSDVIIIK